MFAPVTQLLLAFGPAGGLQFESCAEPEAVACIEPGGTAWVRSNGAGPYSQGLLALSQHGRAIASWVLPLVSMRQRAIPILRASQVIFSVDCFVPSCCLELGKADVHVSLCFPIFRKLILTKATETIKGRAFPVLLNLGHF